jgi:hypothetical protein
LFIGNKKCRIYAACGVSQTPIKIHFKRGEPDIGKKQNDIVADTCFQHWLCRLYGEKSGGRTGRTCKK